MSVAVKPHFLLRRENVSEASRASDPVGEVQCAQDLGPIQHLAVDIQSRAMLGLLLTSPLSLMYAFWKLLLVENDLELA